MEKENTHNGNILSEATTQATMVSRTGLAEDWQNVVDKIIAEKGTTKNALIPILQSIQHEYNYLPEKALRYVCEKTDITPAQLTGVAGFYHQFRMEPAGQHIIKVCVGTACHVKGAGRVHDAFKRELKIEQGKTTDKSGQYTVSEVSCLGCCTLAPVVQIDDVTYGHVQPDQINQVLNDFEIQSKRKSKSLFRKPSGEEIKGEIRIGLGSCCVASGSGEIQKAVEEAVAGRNVNVKLKSVGCVGMCHQVPLVEVVPLSKNPILYSKVKAEDVPAIIDSHFKPESFLKRMELKVGKLIENIQNDEHWEGVQRYELDVRDKPVSQFLGKQIPIATEHRGEVNPLDIENYIATGGFTGYQNARKLKPGEISDLVSKSGLRGRGGGGFPTGSKWIAVDAQESDIKYLICNGDEGDPGAFMDRMLLESYPYRVIEGMMIGAYAVGATHCYFYIRAEYPLAVKRIREALTICKQKGYIGKGSPLNIEMEIYEGAGAFVCGEETALLKSIEGERGFPKARPPFPAQKGLWGKPTLVNNTETWAMVPFILRNGANRFTKIGSENSKGTKVFSLAGKIARGGLIEVPMGISIREIVEVIGGGVADGKQLKAVQIGGPSGGCIPHWLADTPVDFASLSKLGAMMGSGGLVVLDETDCMVDIARYFLSFTQAESCGKCTFCRIGTKRMLDIMERITEGKGKTEDLAELEKIAEWTFKGSLCNLGKTAPNPILTTLRYFRDEYEAHINGVCPTGKCKAMVKYTVNDKCIGCTLCSQKCPVDAIPFNPHQKHEINQELCIKCDSCVQVCPYEAIDVG
ncbi:MAG TPA: NAD(P)H-dependent oxidoreductase subunit E [Prolixibacteraceae bacterium]|nr:NAD(P)H-dependent oxidoreductase subunit E [Prolixibacteraceae bacterium]